jgi:murein L,D-transpeptidase YcbB/YkuD
MKHLFLGLTMLIAADAAAESTFSDVLRDRIEWLMFQTDLVIDGEPILSRDLLPELYAENEYQPLWEERAKLDRLDDLVEFAYLQGLDPVDYPLDALAELLPEEGMPEDTLSRVKVDVLATEILVRITYQVRFGKVNPYELYPDWNFDRELLPGEDPVQMLLDIMRANALHTVVTREIERGPVYQAMVRGLAEYRRIAEQGGWPEIPAGPTLRLGEQGERVQALRARLQVSGELEAAETSAVFDEQLQDAVQVFQARHGLEADGVVGPATLRAMNVPVADRIQQIRASLERGRWVFEDLHRVGNRLVLVNIAAAEVSVLQGREFIWQSRAQIGKPYRQTPVFRDEIQYLVFNPTWTVPPTILREDVIPRLVEDPAGYLVEKNMDLLNRDGQVVNATDVDWSAIGPDNFPYIVRQRPGPWNALGMVKFIFPNPHFVFLHDTPARELFARADRAFSSGCVRVEDPFTLAELLFDEPNTWNMETFQEILDSRQMRTVHLDQPVPVFLMYLTAQPGMDGSMHFFGDIYGRDRQLLTALDAAPTFVPVQ